VSRRPRPRLDDILEAVAVAATITARGRRLSTPTLIACRTIGPTKPLD
jgi:hypothetical protein